MAIIVNKEEKRRNIALSCREILLAKGINNLTISQIAQTAGVGKGTVYEYFDNKEDIVFEIISIFIMQHEEELRKTISETVSTKEKIFHLLYLLFSKENSEHLKIYREFIAISLSNGTEEMKAFSIKCKEHFSGMITEVLEDAIANGEIKYEVSKLVEPLLTFNKGLIIESQMVNMNAKKAINNFLNVLFDLIEIKDR